MFSVRHHSAARAKAGLWVMQGLGGRQHEGVISSLPKVLTPQILTHLKILYQYGNIFQRLKQKLDVPRPCGLFLPLNLL